MPADLRRRHRWEQVGCGVVEGWQGSMVARALHELVCGPDGNGRLTPPQVRVESVSRISGGRAARRSDGRRGSPSGKFWLSESLRATCYGRDRSLDRFKELAEATGPWTIQIEMGRDGARPRHFLVAVPGQRRKFSRR